MLRECLHHSADTKWAYATGGDTFCLRLRTKRNDVEEAVVLAGDKYDWDGTAAEIGMEKIAACALYDYWEAVVAPAHQRFSYAFRARQGEEVLWLAEGGVFEDQPHPPGGYFEVPFLHEVDLFRAPDWARDAVLYQIMPDRFYNGDSGNDPEHVRPWGETPEHESHFGGDLQGILEKLDYLSELGVNALYLTPIFTSPTNHKYDTVDYKEIDPQFGDKALLKKLVDACHEREIRVVLDAVFNHASENFAPFRDVLEKGEASDYKDWFHLHDFPVEVRGGRPNYASFGFFGNMPKLNTANPEVKRYLLEVAVDWIKETGIDGWRLDVANEIDHAFWREFRQAVKSANPEAFIIGEVWGDALRWLRGDQFDSVMNYPVTNEVLDYFAHSNGVGAAFAEEINRLLMRYPQPVSEAMLNLLSSHDVPRAATRLGGNRQRFKQAIAYMMTSIGIPCIYYGDEVGLYGEDDPDCRKCMEWNEEAQDHDLLDYYKIMIDLRKRTDALRHGSFRFLHADDTRATFIFERIGAYEHVTVWMNNTEEQVVLAHPMEADGWTDLLTGEELQLSEAGLEVELEPLGFRLLQRKL